MNTEAELADKKLASHLKALVEDAEELMNATAGQPDEIPNAAGAGFKQGCNTYQEEPCSEYGCLNERKPIVTQPLRKGHASIIPDPVPVSSV